MTDRYIPLGYSAPPAAPQMQRYAQPQQNPQQMNAPLPPQEGLTYPQPTPPPYQVQTMPYNPNASPTDSWALEPVPSNLITPMNPNKGKTLDEIPGQMAWRGY